MKDKDEIRDMGLTAISEYFQLDQEQLGKLPKLTLNHLYQKAKLGMGFEREMGIQNRSTERNTLRVLTLISTDKKELKKLLKKSLPQYVA